MRTPYHARISRLPRLGAALCLGLALSLVSLFAVAQETPQQISLTSAQKASIHTGDVHVELTQGDVNRGVVVGIIQAPMAEVIPYVANCWEYGDWREALIDTNLERRVSDEVVICSGTAVVPFPARNRSGHFRVYNRVTEVDGIESFVSNFDYVKDSGNLENMFGYWLVHPYGPNGEHTILKHVLNVDIGGFLPGALVRWATRRTLPDTVFGIRKQIAKANGANLSGPQFWRDHNYD